jgi:vitamin B12 transporter
MPALPIDTDQIVITGSRAPQSEAKAPESVTIIDTKRIERLGDPLIPTLLRLSPSAAVATSGPLGSLAEVRIRGAEANHSLVFVDGIKINDPASGDTPRFEILNADLASRIEVVRGPQSALWGSEAIGGVIAINGTRDARGYGANFEGGSFGFLRASASGAYASNSASVAGGIGWQRATGIDSFDGQGDKDGYRNLSGRIRASWQVGPRIELGASALALTGRTEFDGFDPITFAHTDTLDSSRNRLAAGRLWANLGNDNSPWRGQISGSLLGSSNKNYLDDVPQNRTRGTRRILGAQLERRFITGTLAHTLIAAADSERETFRARDTAFGGFTNQDRSRAHQSVTFEWRGETEALTGDVAVRRDLFNRFRDATSVRASALVRVGGGFTLAGSYGKGISQPAFFDLYGFFPNNFIGNSGLKPESSRGFEGAIRFQKGRVAASLTAYRQRLHDEIVTIFPPPTFIGTTVNLNTTSRRQGIEAELGWSIGEQLRLTANYSYLDATEPGAAAGAQVRELRRPKHGASLALDGSSGRFTYGASLAYIGRHFDSRDTFPFDRVPLGSYWLADGRVAYEVRPGIALFARGSNLLDQKYQDVFGYRTEGRGLFAGIRFRSADRRSSP